MDETHTSTPSMPNQATTVSDFPHNRWFLIGFYSLAVLWGIRNIYHNQPSMLDLLIPIALSICLGWWAVTDARRRRQPIPLTAQVWFFILAVLVVPGYVIWSRGWRGMAWVALHLFIWYLVVTIAFHLGGVLVYGKAWLQALGL